MQGPINGQTSLSYGIKISYKLGFISSKKLNQIFIVTKHLVCNRPLQI